jgi:hypothetical protein
MLIATARLYQLKPFESLKNIIARQPDYPHKNVADLLRHTCNEKHTS